ncbi:MAG: exodeoxyribonuclease VII large subunit [Planctomycetes bacterium]|nr:exodeoxyribonuclease VII large subunit [Planctomycetota bacterium]
MTGSVELDPDGTNLLIRFQYREDLVSLVKEFPGRRWDPRQKLWRVPAAHVARVFTVLSRHLFDFAPEIPSLLAGTLGQTPKAPAEDTTPADEAGTATAGAAETPSLRVSEFNALVRDGLRRQFPEALWITGEVVDYDKAAGREHRFFRLVEKAPQQPRALAAVEVALFGGTAERLQQRFGTGADAFALRDGIEVRLLVKVDLYVASGRFQVVVQDVDPSFTLGKLALTREQILRELRDQGLAEANRGLRFPVPALRLGVLTSPDSDGWNDFLRHLQESPVGFDVTLVPIKVQGVELKPSLLAGLQWFAARAAAFDVLCILRGGGSRTDLAWFDDRDVAFAVARHPLKVLVGIGHQRDQSVLDAIAHSEKTPTAVAAFLVAAVTGARTDLAARGTRLAAAAATLLDEHRSALDDLLRGLLRGSERCLQQRHAWLAQAGRGLAAATLLRLSRESADLRGAAARAAFAVQRRFDAAHARLAEMAARQRLLDPARVLGRGYALVRSTAGAVLPSAARLARDQTVLVQFRDGRATARVVDVQSDSP